MVGWIETRRLKKMLAALFYFAICFLVIRQATQIGGDLWTHGWVLRNVVRIAIWGIGMGVSYGVSRWVQRRWKLGDPSRTIARRQVVFMLGVFCLALVIFGLSTVSRIHHYYFLGWSVEQNHTLVSFLSSVQTWYILLSWGLVPCFVWWNPRRWLPTVMWVGLILSQCLCCWMFLQHTGFTMAYSDDHPSFLFRVTEFIGAFPWRENYVPYWNAGVVNSVITSSGVASYSILGLPFWLTIPIEKAAPIVFLMIFVWMVPWVTYGGFRAAGFGRVGASLAGTLILGQGFLFYLWLLRFGTVGASLSMAMVPAVFAYLYSLLYQPKVSRWAFVGFLFSVVLMGQWPPMLVFGVPLGIWILVEWKRWWYGLNRWLFVGVAFAAAVLLVPTVVGALMGKEVLGHVLDAPEKPVVTWALAKKEFLTEIVSVCSDMNPLVLFAGLAWFCWLPWRRVRLWVCVIGFFVFSISAWGPMFLPNMQLARMGLAFSCVMVVPTVCVVRKILLARGILAPVVQAMVMALILCTFQNVARYYGGRTDNPFVGMRPIVHELADCVTELVPPDGRFLFAGASVHAYGRGHTAFLPKLADREMMGCDYYGFPRGMVEMNYPPHRFRTLPDGCYRFAKLWGVTHVIAYRPDQVAFYEADTTHFRRCRHLQDTSEHQNCEYVIFEVVEPDVGRFLKGSGEVKADFNRFEVTIDPRMTVGEEIVLRYNWHERLVAEGPVELYPYAVEPQEKLIGIRLLARPTEPIQIRYNSRF